VDAAMEQLRGAANAENLPAAGGAATAVNQAGAGLHVL